MSRRAGVPDATNLYAVRFCAQLTLSRINIRDNVTRRAVASLRVRFSAGKYFGKISAIVEYS